MKFSWNISCNTGPNVRRLGFRCAISGTGAPAGAGVECREGEAYLGEGKRPGRVWYMQRGLERRPLVHDEHRQPLEDVLGR